jgi:hypothetical protein
MFDARASFIAKVPTELDAP